MKTLMKSVIFGGLGAALSAVAASAATFAPPDLMSGLGIVGTDLTSTRPPPVNSSNPLDPMSDTLTLNMPSVVNLGATFELSGTIGQQPTFTNLTFGLEPQALVGTVVDVPFNRANITPGQEVMPPGAQTGVLRFDFTEITEVVIDTEMLGTNVTLVGLLEVMQIAGTPFYEDAIGEFRINAEFADFSQDNYTLNLIVRNQVVPLPAPALLLVSGLAGLAILRRRRAASAA